MTRDTALRHRYTIAVDFDGVLHSYTSPWVAPHVIPDPPVSGSMDWLADIQLHFDVVIFTTRGKTWRGRRAVRKWLERECGYTFRVTDRKPAALVYIDDRAWRFNGITLPGKDEIHMARPWNKAKA